MKVAIAMGRNGLRIAKPSEIGGWPRRVEVEMDERIFIVFQERQRHADSLQSELAEIYERAGGE